MKNLIFFFIVVVFFVFSLSSVAQWTEQTSGVTTALYSVQSRDSLGYVVWACGASGKILKTTNGGATWTVYTLSPNPSLSLYNIWGNDAQLCLVTGSSSTAAYIYRTTNGGANWTEVFNQPGGFINVIGQVEETGTLAFTGDPVGGRWTNFVSTDYGLTWDSTGYYNPQSGSEAGWNNSAYAVYPTVYYTWYGTNNTRIYKWNTMTWDSLATPGLTNSYALFAVDFANIMVGGTIMLFSTNSGYTFTNVNAPGTGNILGIAGVGTKWWYVRGSSIYYSANNGTSWSTDYTSTGTYYDLGGAGSGHMWAVKSNGGISKYTPPTGIRPINKEVPVHYAIYQNYPNPFNPVTKIRFDIPNNTSVNITVYNSLGKEITTLVNEKLNAGRYEVDWNASEYPSGVYFYKLVTDEFTDVKKMILLK